jgi:hypothetical protein
VTFNYKGTSTKSREEVLCLHSHIGESIFLKAIFGEAILKTFLKQLLENFSLP